MKQRQFLHYLYHSRCTVFSPPKTTTKIKKETLKNGHHHRHSTWPLSFSNRRTVVSTPGQGPNVWSIYERGRFDRLAPNEFFCAFVPFSCRWPNCIPKKDIKEKQFSNKNNQEQHRRTRVRGVRRGTAQARMYGCTGVQAVQVYGCTLYGCTLYTGTVGVQNK